MGNSPVDLAAVAGHRTEELLKTYAKQTGEGAATELVRDLNESGQPC
jgi:hypothetical protein